MSTRADCIRAVVAAGATEEQAADIVDAIMEEKKRLREAGRLTPENLEQAWRERAPEVERITALKRRRAMLSAIRRNEALADIRRAREAGFSFSAALTALLVGRSRRFTGARPSIAARRRALFTSWAEPLARELDSVGAEGEDGMGKGGVLKLLREDKSFHDAVIVAMCEADAKAEPLVRETAEIVARYAGEARRRFNLAGGDMGRLEGWTPQLHSVEKLLRAGPEKWKTEILPLLDRERTFGRAADAERISERLDGIYHTLTLGGNPFLAAGSGSGGDGGGKNAARPPEQSGVLYFASGRDAVKYHDLFGSGSLIDAVLRHLERMARAVALMERLGPDPEQTVRRLIADERARVHADKTLDREAKDGLLRRPDAAMTSRVPDGATAMRLAELTGEASEGVFPTLAKVGIVQRAVQTLDKLGGAALSAVSDPFLKAAGMRCNGETWPSAIMKSVLRYLEDHDDVASRRAAAGQAAVFLDALTGSLAAAWDEDGEAPGKIARIRNWQFRWTGLDWITEQGRAGYGLWLAGHIGENAEHDRDALPPDLQAMLDRHGVDAARWDALRSMTAVAEDGKRYFLPVDVAPDDARLEALLPEDLRREPPADAERAARFAAAREAGLARLRERLRADALALLADETAFAIPEPDDAVRDARRRDMRRGTSVGRFWRFLMASDGFPLSRIQRITGGRRWLRGSRQADMRRGVPSLPGMPGVQSFAMLAVSFGYAATILKDIAEGRKPRDPRDRETWLAACLRSGGLGIFADFLFGELSRFSGDKTAPSGRTTADAARDFAALLVPVPHDKPKQTGAQPISKALDETPFVNMWMLRAGLNYALLRHVREWMSPGGLRRMERRLKKQRGRESFLPPSSVIRRGDSGAEPDRAFSV